MQRIITDAQGRRIRIEQTSGNVVLMQYEGDNEEPSDRELMMRRARCLNRQPYIQRNTLYSKRWMERENAVGKRVCIDARGNWTSARITDWIDGEERVQETASSGI